jgi:trk system potassium uptake protein TrkA
MKRFVVIGLGNFGYNIAMALAEQQHEVTVVDEDEKKIQEIKDKVAHAIVADAMDKKVLSEFVDTESDAIIVGLGDDIAASVLVVLHLKEQGAKNIIAKAVNENHGKILATIGANEIIHPEKDVATRLAMRLTFKNLIEHIPMATDYSIIELAVPDNLVGRTLGELKLRNRYNVEVIAIKNVLLDTFHLIPTADFRISADSALVIIGKMSDIDNLKL